MFSLEKHTKTKRTKKYNGNCVSCDDCHKVKERRAEIKNPGTAFFTLDSVAGRVHRCLKVTTF